ACLAAGVEPDFVILVDPQYWNMRHLDGLSASKSILITEAAAWPSVFRFKCRRILLCSSQYAPGKFIENRIGKKGELSAGGSVATAAWDFARFIGCTTIITAGLDLGFPAGKTHSKGSTFEERAHMFSHRLHPAETDSFQALYSAAPFYAPDYEGNQLLTDRRMSLYGWWFESRRAAFPGITAGTVSPRGLRIPGMQVFSMEEIEAFPVMRAQIDAVLAEFASEGTGDAGAGMSAEAVDDAVFDRAVEELETLLASLKEQEGGIREWYEKEK
ncbi:MAG: DUF115 domain-containing protein, partial [Spirochaetaceae bacterium]|nr:DUF115 domain-containing protein [Spirochaetaceae bacterium]